MYINILSLVNLAIGTIVTLLILLPIARWWGGRLYDLRGKTILLTGAPVDWV